MDINNLNKMYGKLKALDNICIRDIKGIHGLVGENGAGKTTLMRIVATVLEKDSGSITHNGISWEETVKVRNIIGYLPQKFGMYHQLTVNEALEHVAILKRINGDPKEESKKVISLVNLDDKAESKVGSLSGGMIRRLGIAQAILGNPEILIVDEPTSGLDPEERMRFKLLLRQLGNRMTVLFSTHIVDDIEDVCDRVTVMHKGKVMLTGTAAEMIEMAQGNTWTVSSNEEKSGEELGGVVTDCKYANGMFHFRLVSDKKPAESAVRAEPTLEEAYIYLLHME